LDPKPEVVSGFDPPLSTYGSGHRGVDLAGTAGQEVRAAAGGRVTYAGSLAGRGVVVVSHGTTRTTYEPVEPGVERGSIVPAGAVIGTLQTFGSHCAPRVCLHWGLIEGETYLDPLTLVGAGPVRLLPLGGAVSPADPGLGARFFGQGAA
jgi:murein DD-endopeptidase MepM/ murein hydrolase activator NlpD